MGYTIYIIKMAISIKNNIRFIIIVCSKMQIFISPEITLSASFHLSHITVSMNEYKLKNGLLDLYFIGLIVKNNYNKLEI